nr:FeoA family protein [Planktothrix mougeotii]
MPKGRNFMDRWWQDLKQERSFVYLSESPNQKMSGEDRSEMANSSESELSTISLAETKVGDRVRIVSLNSGEGNNRLMAMGLMPGAILEVISCTGTGSAIVAFNGQRLGLGADMAQNISITKIPSSVGAFNQMTANQNSTVKLRDAAIGSILKVIGYEATSRDYKRKLLAMGLTPSTEFRVTRHAPLGDPTEIEVRGFRLSLRKGEADALIVEPV